MTPVTNSSVVSVDHNALKLMVGRQEGHLAYKKLGVGLLLVYQFYRNFAHLTAPVVITTSIITLSSNIIYSRDILVPANTGPPGKMAIKMERGGSQCEI